MKVSCYILYFPHKILISLPFFMTLYYICPTHSTLTLGENGKYPVDWFVADDIRMYKQRRLLHFSEFVWP
jgi:hypothetical protein